MKLEVGDEVVFSGTNYPVLRILAMGEPGRLTDGGVRVQWPRRDGSMAEETYRNADGLTLAEPIMQFFRYKHLPEHLQKVSGMFGVIAQDIVRTLPANPQRTMALELLLQAKDAGVRAALYET